MLSEKIRSIRPSYWLYAFVFIHVTVWTLAPATIRFALPMDSIEGILWGHQLELGYDKNPFMNAWLSHLAVWLDGHSGWMIYLFSQLSVGICFWAMYRLGKKFFSPAQAFVSVMLLEGLQYYSFHAIDFNDNTLELSLWALTALFFYQAINDKKLSDWLLTASFAALGMMAKYYTAILLLPMALLMIATPEGRDQFRSRYFYLACILFIAIILPHTIWLFSHDFITVQYAFDRVSSPPTWFSHVLFPTQFAWQQFEVLIPALLLFALLLRDKTIQAGKYWRSLPTFDRKFLGYVGMGPLVITILLSAFTGIRLRAGWGQPLLSFSGMILLAWFMPSLSRKQLTRFIIATFTLMFLMVTIYCVALIRADAPSSANFPSKMIASTLTDEWRNQYGTPLHYVAGPRWLAGSIAFYSKDQPAVYMSWDKQFSPWIDEAALKKSGAIFVWDPTERERTPMKEVLKRFPNLGPIHTMYFSWMRNHKMKPVEMRVAFLPPSSKLIEAHAQALPLS